MDNLTSKEKLKQLIEKLPDEKIQKILDVARKMQSSEEFIHNNLLDGIDEIMDKHDGLLKRLSD